MCEPLAFVKTAMHENMLHKQACVMFPACRMCMLTHSCNPARMRTAGIHAFRCSSACMHVFVEACGFSGSGSQGEGQVTPTAGAPGSPGAPGAQGAPGAPGTPGARGTSGGAGGAGGAAAAAAAAHGGEHGGGTGECEYILCCACCCH